MNLKFNIQRATADEADGIAELVGELLTEIMNSIGIQAFNFDQNKTTSRLYDFLEQEKYFVFVARCEDGIPAGFISLYESYALYAEGVFGTIPELYVRPKYRSHEIGLHLLSHAKTLAISRSWSRLEVTTPPLPEFDRTLAFYEREGFTISGGRKLRLSL